MELTRIVFERGIFCAQSLVSCLGMGSVQIEQSPTYHPACSREATENFATFSFLLFNIYTEIDGVAE